MAQIGLSVYHIMCLSVFLAKDLSSVNGDVLLFIASLLVSKAPPLFLHVRTRQQTVTLHQQL